MKAPIAWQYFDDCVEVARAILRDEDAARDVALEALTDTKGRALSLKQLRQRTRWRANDRLRDNNRAVLVVRGFDVDGFASCEPTPEQALTAARAVASVLSDATDRTVAVVSAAIVDVPDARVAEALGLTEASVRKIRSRARRRFLDQL